MNPWPSFHEAGQVYRDETWLIDYYVISDHATCVATDLLSVTSDLNARDK